MKISLSKRQKSIIIGSILGDGYLDFNGYQGTRLQIKQCQKNKEYVWWLYNELKNLCKSEPNMRKDGSQWFFGTRYIDELTGLRKDFYSHTGKKKVPDQISEMLVDPLSLAIWFMDDGTLDFRPKSHFAFSLAVNCFSLKDVKKLADAMLKNFGITTSINNSLCRGKRYPRLHVGKDGRIKFMSIIKPYIVSCFRYKLPSL